MKTFQLALTKGSNKILTKLGKKLRENGSGGFDEWQQGNCVKIGQKIHENGSGGFDERQHKNSVKIGQKVK